jgi:predicted aspartyl protease
MRAFKPNTNVIAIKSPVPGRLGVLTSDVTVINPITNKQYTTKGIWDTGATHTVIAQEVVDDLGILQLGMAEVYTASEKKKQTPTFEINIILNSRIRFDLVTVTRGSVTDDCHCLIGMDIITMGDFNISNVNGNTIMSYMIPSQHDIDFLREIEAFNKIIKKHFDDRKGANTPCSCGSRKKFKNCHGIYYPH